MDTELLRTFLAVDKHRHFGRAAENIYLTPAAVSARIRQLEGMIGAPLFTRHRNNITLTPAGEALKPHAEKILDSWNRALHESSSVQGPTQQLVIGSTSNLWDSAIQNHLHQIYHAYPDIIVRTESQGSELLLAQLQGRQLDMVILLAPLTIDGTIRRRIAEFTLVLVSTVAGAEASEAFACNYVQVDWGRDPGMQNAQPDTEQNKPVLCTSSGRIALNFILAHGGSAYLPRSMVQNYLDCGELHMVSNARKLTQGVFASYLQDSSKKPLMQKLSRLFREAPPASNAPEQTPSKPG